MGYYFNAMKAWYRYTQYVLFQGNQVKTEVKTFTAADEHFDERIDGSATNKRYHIHVGHLYDMAQEGYQPRTKNNRVRCARVAPNS